MSGFVGEYAKRRNRRKIFLLIIIILIFLYYFFIHNAQILENNFQLSEEKESKKEFLTSDEYELLILEKNQKIVFRDSTIQSLNKKIELLNKRNNELLKSNELKDLEFENNIDIIQTNKVNENQKLKNLIQQLRADINSIDKEKKIIEKEYKIIAKRNLDLNAKLNNNIDHKEKIKNLELKISQLEILLEKKEKIIKKLNDLSHH